MKTKVIYDGQIEVTDQGDVFKIKNGIKSPAAIAHTSRNGRYAAFSINEGGKQKHIYVHRAIAEAFIPNPNNYPQINHKDGVPSNNAVENLEWCTAQQNIIHAYKTGLMNPAKWTQPCVSCGEPTHAKDGLCPVCKRIAENEVQKESRLADIRDELGAINYDTLTDREYDAVKMRMQGLTYEEIARADGVSRQCIEQRIKNALIKSVKPKTQPKSIKRKKEKLKTKLISKQAKLDRLMISVKDLESEINEISTAYESIEIIGDRQDRIA